MRRASAAHCVPAHHVVPVNHLRTGIETAIETAAEQARAGYVLGSVCPVCMRGPVKVLRISQPSKKYVDLITSIKYY